MAGLTLASRSAERRGYSPWRETWRRYRRHKLAVVSAVLLLVLATAVIVGPFIWRIPINEIDFTARLEGPSFAHPFGTDDLGQDILARVGTRIITLGSEGARVERRGEDPLVVGPVKDATFVEPTGAGDAFRCGFLAAVSWGLSTERAIQLGNLMAVHVLETVGPQEYELKPAPLADRARTAYGDEAAAELAAHLPA